MSLAKGLLGIGTAGAGLGGLFASDDAEAGVSGLVRNLPEAIAAINKAVRGGAGQRNPIGVLEDVMHNTKYSNYDEMGEYALKVDGDTAGDYWKGEVQSMADQLRKAGGLTDEADGHLQAWLDDHLGRELGYRPPMAKPAPSRAPKPKAPENNAFGDLKTMMAAAGAAGAAGSTKAGEMTSPEIRGFQPWSDFEPEPSYWDRVTDPSTYASALMPYFEAGSWLANTPVGKYVGGQVGEAMDAAEIPGRFIQGAGRAGYGVLNGESLPEAFNAGRDTYGNTLAENGEALEQWGIDRGWHEDDASAASTFATYGLDPLTYAGFGLLGKIGGALK